MSPPPPLTRLRDLIRKVWDADPLLCPNCGGQMKLIAVIEDGETIEKLLRHLNLWEDRRPARPPPTLAPPEQTTYEPFYDDMPYGTESFAA